MGTNYYRIPSAAEMERRKKELIETIGTTPIDPSSIANYFREYEDYDDPLVNLSVWDKFIYDIKIHVGKRSGGWKFLWNFNDNKFYSNKQELLAFIRSGRIVDEYGQEEPVEEFIEMALSWGQPNGLVFNEAYEKEQLKNYPARWIHGSKYWDREIDELRVSTCTEFS